MKPVMVLLPMDDRPVNYDYPGYLARLAGYELHLPPRDWLGNPWHLAQHSSLLGWLNKEADLAQVLVVAVDTLVYGGLIPSRTSNEPLEKLLERLSLLKEIKNRRPGLSILASSVVMRISRANSSEEEKDYWATYGRDMFNLSYLEHKISLGEADGQEIAECASLSQQIPANIREDYLAGRRRNHAINLTMLDWVEQDLVDYLLLPQDDTATYGWNIAEARALQSAIRKKGLTECAITYPGADEIGCILLAGAVCRQTGFKPKVYPRYSSINSANVTTAYEDRPIHELLKAHLAPLGGTIAAVPCEADLQLYLNAPAFEQGEASLQWLVWRGLDALRTELPASMHPHLDALLADPIFQKTRREMETPWRSPEEFLRAILLDLESKKSVAIADVAYSNGADLLLGNLLVQRSEIVGLSAYGGWNTTGNTLGTVLAQAVLHILAQKNGLSPDQASAQLEFLFLRFLDDYYYQVFDRTQCMLEDLPALGLQPSMERLPQGLDNTVEAKVRKRLKASAEELERLFLRNRVIDGVEVDRIRLPWRRLFEVGFDVRIRQNMEEQQR